MSALDIPPGLEFAGKELGALRARPRTFRLARATLLISAVDALLTFYLSRGRMVTQGGTLFFIGPLLCISMAAVGYTVRRARLLIDELGVRWGWNALGFRVPKRRVRAVRLYENGLEVHSGPGRSWYLSRYDWEEFDRLPALLRSAGFPVTAHSGKASFRSRSQSYGPVLDSLMILTLILSGVLLLGAVLR